MERGVRPNHLKSASSHDEDFDSIGTRQWLGSSIAAPWPGGLATPGTNGRGGGAPGGRLVEIQEPCGEPVRDRVPHPGVETSLLEPVVAQEIAVRVADQQVVHLRKHSRSRLRA